MPSAKDLHEKIRSFHGSAMSNPHSRYRSWEHCYQFFRSRTSEMLVKDKDAAALHLGFYLASWGMYRGSGFLLQHTYTIHLAVIDRLVLPVFADLWKREVGSEPVDQRLVPSIETLIDTVREAYQPNKATDILVTKVMLGTVGCLPAVDRFFVDGFRKSGNQYSGLKRSFVERIIQFCNENLDELRSEQARIEEETGVRYPLIKLADEYFWQTGFDLAPPNRRKKLELGEE